MAKAANASRYYGTGRRKKAIARVYLVPGTGNITINKRTIDEYFGLETLKTSLIFLLTYVVVAIQDRLVLSDMVSPELYYR